MADFSSAVFRDTPVTVTQDGRDYVFPVLTAQQWLAAMAQRERWPVLVLHHADADSIETFLDEAEAGRADADALLRLARAVLAESAGRPWWEAERLCVLALSRPELLGEVLSRGVDPARMTIAAFLAVLWSRVVQGVSETERMAAQAQLSAPPPEALPEMGDDMDLTAMAQMFRGMQGARVG